MIQRYVSFRKSRDARYAIKKFDGMKIGAKKLRVKYAKKKYQRTYYDSQSLEVNSIVEDSLPIIKKVAVENRFTNVYISNIPYSHDIWKDVIQFGPIRRINAHMQGVALVDFYNHSDAVRAIVSLHGITLPHAYDPLQVRFASLKNQLLCKDSEPIVYFDMERLNRTQVLEMQICIYKYELDCKVR
jgi:RNA recognition motif-containing protein